MKRLFTLCIGFFSALLVLQAQTRIGDLYYLLDSDDHTAMVTMEGYFEDNYSYLSGALVIPATVSYEGAEYTVTGIMEHAFYGCTALTKVTIPETMLGIGFMAFSETGITSVVWKARNAERYGYYSLHESMPLQSGRRKRHDQSVSAVFPTPFQGIESQIVSFEFGEEVEVIPSRLCNGMRNLNKIHIPASVTWIGTDVFAGTGLNALSVAQDNPVYDSRDNCNAIVHTESNTLVAGCGTTVVPRTITAIGYGAFASCRNLTTIVLPDGVKEIQGRAFAASALQSVTLPNTLTTIEYNAFSNTNLTAVALPSGLTEIGNSAFSYCYGLASVSFPNTLTLIGEEAFYGCESLSAVTIPAGVNHIGEDAFSGCPALGTLVVDEANPVYDSRDNCNAVIKTAGDTLVAGCHTTVIPLTVTAIDSCAFYNCQTLTSLVIPEGVTFVGASAFERSGLTSIVFPNTVSFIGEGALADCQNLLSVTLPEGLGAIADALFEDCESLAAVNIPQSVTTIGEDAFRSCSALSVLTIPSEVASIGEDAFRECRLEELHVLAAIPPKISENTFDGHYYSDEDDWEDDEEDEDNEDYDRGPAYAPAEEYEGVRCKVYVPETSLDTYKKHRYWGRLNIVGEVSDGVADVSEDRDSAFRVVNGRLVFAAPVAFEVYSLSGQSLYGGVSDAVALPAGVCIVRVGDNVCKVVVR